MYPMEVKVVGLVCGHTNSVLSVHKKDINWGKIINPVCDHTNSVLSGLHATNRVDFESQNRADYLQRSTKYIIVPYQKRVF